MLGTLLTSTDAFACLDHCSETFGSVRRIDDYTYWELDSCTQYYNAGGGVTTKCYYKVHTFTPE